MKFVFNKRHNIEIYEMKITQQYFENLAKNYVEMITEENLNDLRFEDIMDIANKNSIDIHFLKRLNNPRIIWAVNHLRGLRPTSILDIGSGKGYILWYANEILKDVKLTAIDNRPIQVKRIQCVAKSSGIPLSVVQADAHSLPFSDKRFDVVTLLEVLEHTNNPHDVIEEACRVCKQWVLLSVPSREDDNPEHIHLFNKTTLRDIFELANVTDLRFSQDSNHIYVQAKVF